MDSDRNILVRHVLDTVDGLTLTKRVHVLRGLASVIGDPDETSDLNQLADELEAADHRCREFAFRFSNPQRKAKL